MTVPWVWSETRQDYVSLDRYWKRYKMVNNPPTIAELAAEAKIPPATFSVLFTTYYGKKYKAIAESRRCGKSQVLISDETYHLLFHRYKARQMTLKELGDQENVSASILSTHFRRLFGAQYEAIANRRRAHA